MLEQHGPNQIRNAIEHDYFYKRYDKALTLALGFIRVAQTNKQCKVSGTKEMTDIAMHCAAKLNRLDVLEDLLDNKTVSKHMCINALPIYAIYLLLEACTRYRPVFSAR